jgi:uncharacterized membrane protein YuzA (DUF378 family)
VTLNPWAALMILIALGVVVIGFKGNEQNLVAAVLGRPYKSSSLK